MKKIIALVLSILMLTLALSSCGEKVPYEKSETEKALFRNS